MAFVLSPGQTLQGGTLLLDLGVLALFDALAVLAPPKVPLWIIPPGALVIDGGRVASLRMDAAPYCVDGVPDWAVLEIDVALSTDDSAPGERPDQTCLAEEGFGDVSPEDVLIHTCRHMLGWLDVWRHEGATALTSAISQRTARSAVTA